MKNLLTEEALRMQRLAGLIKEEKEDFSDWDDEISLNFKHPDGGLITRNPSGFEDEWLEDNYNKFLSEVIYVGGLDKTKPIGVKLDNGRLDITKFIKEISISDFCDMVVESWSKSRDNRGEGGPDILRSCIFEGTDEFDTSQMQAPEGYSADTDLRAFIIPDWYNSDEDPLNYNVYIFQK